MSRRERKKKMTKENIIDCAISLFKEKGFQETYMEKIAEESDISKGTLYNYFQDKESILVAYFQTIIIDKSIDITTSFNKIDDIKFRLNNILDCISNIFQKDMELAVIYFRYRMQSFFNNNPFDNSDRSGLENLIVQVIKEAQNNGELRTDISLEIMARNFEFLCMNYFISSIYSSEEFNADIFKKQIVELFINGAS